MADPPTTTGHAIASATRRTLRSAWVGSLGADLIAGLTLAAIAVPEQMATARLAGFAPQIGLIAFVAGGAAFAVFGANRMLSSGADSTITPIFAGSLATMAVVGSHQYAELAAALALMVGLMVALAGVLKLGWVADLLSRPITIGFLAGIALHIVLAQAPSALGLPEESGDVYHRLPALVGALGRINWIAGAISLGVFVVTLGAERLNPRIPGALIALVGATVATATLGLARDGVAVLGVLPNALSQPAFPHLPFETALPLVGLAFVISLVVMMQTAATTRSFGEDGAPNVNRDFVGVGAGNALAALFLAFPVNASPPRTAAFAAAGGRTKLGSVAAALAVLALAAFGGRLMAQAPTAALAGVLLFVAQRIFHWGEFATLLRRTRAEFALATITAGLIVALPIQTGVAVGVFFSLAHGVFGITRARLIPFERAPGTTVWWPAGPNTDGDQRPEVLVAGFQAPLSFLNVYQFQSDITALIAHRESTARLFVLEASGIVTIDFTASTILADAIGAARAAGLDFAVARLESVRAREAFERLGLIELLGPDHLFQSVAEAIERLAGASDAATPPRALSD
jgi:SulP family sulfate permease